MQAPSFPKVWLSSSFSTPALRLSSEYVLFKPASNIYCDTLLGSLCKNLCISLWVSNFQAALTIGTQFFVLAIRRLPCLLWTCLLQLHCVAPNTTHQHIEASFKVFIVLYVNLSASLFARLPSIQFFKSVPSCSLVFLSEYISAVSASRGSFALMHARHKTALWSSNMQRYVCYSILGCWHGCFATLFVIRSLFIVRLVDKPIVIPGTLLITNGILCSASF